MIIIIIIIIFIFLCNCTMYVRKINWFRDEYDMCHVEKNRKVHKSTMTVPLEDWTS